MTCAFNQTGRGVFKFTAHGGRVMDDRPGRMADGIQGRATNMFGAVEYSDYDPFRGMSEMRADVCGALDRATCDVTNGFSRRRAHVASILEGCGERAADGVHRRFGD